MAGVRRYAKGVDELRDATGGWTAIIYQFACGSVAYFAPDAPDFQEAGELRGQVSWQANYLEGTGIHGMSIVTRRNELSYRTWH